MEVDSSDLQKTLDCLCLTARYLATQDEANALLHKAEIVQWSPLTSEVFATRDRLMAILGQPKIPGLYKGGEP